MKMAGLVLLCTLALALVLSCPAETLVKKLLSDYDGIHTVSCEIRKEMDGPGGKMRMLSRVYYQKPDHIHVDNIKPLKRRYVADGQRLFYYVDGDPKGFSRPVSELDKDWLISLRKVPGTAMDLLMLVHDAPETNLAATAEYSVRRGYLTEKAFAVFSLDKQDRLACVEFYRSPDMEYETARYEYREFREVEKDVWIPLLHKAVLHVDGQERGETTRVSNLAVNEPIAPRLFVAEPFFKGVEFVDSFEEIY